MEGMKFGRKAMALIDDHLENENYGYEPGTLPAMSLRQFYNMITWCIIKTGNCAKRWTIVGEIQ